MVMHAKALLRHTCMCTQVHAFASRFGHVESVRDLSPCLSPRLKSQSVQDFSLVDHATSPVGAGRCISDPLLGAKDCQLEEHQDEGVEEMTKQILIETLTWLWDNCPGGQGCEGATLVLLTNMENLQTLVQRVSSRGVAVVLVSGTNTLCPPLQLLVQVSVREHLLESK